NITMRMPAKANSASTAPLRLRRKERKAPILITDHSFLVDSVIRDRRCAKESPKAAGAALPGDFHAHDAQRIAPPIGALAGGLIDRVSEIDIGDGDICGGEPRNTRRSRASRVGVDSDISG